MIDYSARSNMHRAFQSAHQERARAIHAAFGWLFGTRKT